MLPHAPPSRLIPPGTTTDVVAERVLVLAPHFDDELLGCGGLLRRLAGAGSEIEVVFLTDSSGGVEQDSPSPGEDVAVPSTATRRREAEEVASRGGWRIRCLDFPDGGLAPRVDELAESIQAVLEELRPDLLLVPGPLEVTPDHRASFDATFEVLHPIREDSALRESADGLRVLLYEVNHPAYPQLLVDVSAELGWLEETIQVYASQLELHGYLGAAIGLRRYRSHSLPADVEAAEGYTQLALSDFQTLSRSALAGSLGQPLAFETRDRASVSLVIRTCDRLELLREALRSVRAQQTPPAEVLVVNDGGPDPSALVHEVLPHAKVLQHEQNRGRSAAANSGIAAATGDWVGFLDDDDLLYPEHFTTLVAASSATGVRVVYSDAAVARYRIAGAEERDARDGGGWACVARQLPYSRDFDAERLLVDNYIPFHTLLIQRKLLREVEPLDESLESFEDWDLLIRMAQHAPFHHLRRVTCEYRQFEGADHHVLGGERDDTPSFLEAKAKVLQKHRDLVDPERLAGIVAGMRREAVVLQSALDAERNARTRLERDKRQAENEQAMLTDRFHRLNGEVASLRADRERVGRELEEKSDEARRLIAEEERLGTDLERLRQDLQQRDEDLRATYGEIERLNELVESMRGTRAWRLHEWISRRSS